MIYLIKLRGHFEPALRERGGKEAGRWRSGRKRALVHVARRRAGLRTRCGVRKRARVGARAPEPVAYYIFGLLPVFLFSLPPLSEVLWC